MLNIDNINKKLYGCFVYLIDPYSLQNHYSKTQVNRIILSFTNNDYNMPSLRSNVTVPTERAYRPNLYKSIAFIIGMEKTSSMKGQVMILVEKNLSHLHQIPSMIFLDQKLKLKQYTSIIRVSTSVHTPVAASSFSNLGML